MPEVGRDHRDVVVVGGGLSGLTVGALLARAGKRTVVAEANEKPGGYAASFDAGGYRFQQAIHLIMGGNEGGPFGPGLVRSVLELVGVANRCELFDVDPFYTVRFPGLTLGVAGGRDGYLASHIEQFPAEEKGLTELVDVWSRVYGDFVRWPIRPGFLDWSTAPFRWPRLVRYMNATVDQASRRFLKDPHLRSVHHVLSPGFLGLPPSQASFIVWAVMMFMYVGMGAFFCRGGFQGLADALADGLRQHGGELLLGRKVVQIQVEDGRVTGVLLDDGRRIQADSVVSTIDVRETFGHLIQAEKLPFRWMNRIHTDALSISSFGLYLGTDIDVTAMNPSLETLVMTNWDLEEESRAEARGKPGDVTVTIPTLADPSLAPEGHHQVIVQGTAPTDVQAVDRAELASHYVRQAEQVIPGLRDHITYALDTDLEHSEPQRLPLHLIGPIYGWDNSPSNAGPRRLPQKTPVGGLYLAGQWTQPGHGVWTVMGSGIQAARLILNKSTSGGLYPLSL